MFGRAETDHYDPETALPTVTDAVKRRLAVGADAHGLQAALVHGQHRELDAAGEDLQLHRIDAAVVTVVGEPQAGVDAVAELPDVSRRGDRHPFRCRDPFLGRHGCPPTNDWVDNAFQQAS